MRKKAAPLRPGQRFVKYDIVQLLGTGGHAHVYAAHDPFLDRDVAVKVIAAPKGSGQNLAKRAQSEARVLVRIDHPNVVKVYDAGATEDGLVYLVMERLHGRTLREAYNDVRRISVVEALELAKQICAGVHAAHQLGVIHRDLKPENVFVQANNRIKVLDFGISKVMGYGAHDTTQRHVLHGTVLYMSPEHLQGYGVTSKSDVFALGTLLYEGLYMHPALLWPEVRQVKDVREVIRVQMFETPPMLHELDARIFRHVARFVHRAILKAAEQRYESMADMLDVAMGAWERIEYEQGADYMQKFRRDLSRASGLPRSHDPGQDTVQEAMHFSTAIEPMSQATELGGLTPPPHLTSTTPLDQHIAGLAFQTTTPVPPIPSSDWGPPQWTPAQSATLALAEQLTRTAPPVDEGCAAEARSTGASASMVPVAHASFSDSSARVERRAGTTLPLFRRLPVRIVVMSGAIFGLVLGITYSVTAMRAPGGAASPSDEVERRETHPVAAHEPARAESDVPRPVASASTPTAASASTSVAAAAQPATPAPSPAQAVSAGKRAGERAAAKADKPVRRKREAAKGGATAPAPSAVAKGEPTTNKATSDKASGTWLKPDMIRYPDDSTSAPTVRRDKMPASGLD